jgi:outer membrane protein assembly factor BamB
MVLCVEPQTGKVLWEAPVPPGVSKGVSVFGNVLYVASGAAGGPGKPNPDGVTTAYTLSVEGIKQLWQAPTPYYSGNDFPVTDGKVVVLGGIDRSVLLDAATGKELATYVGPGPYNEGHTTLCEDRVLLSIDGSHGGNHFVPLDASPAAFSKPLNPGWIPPHPPTTAYHNKPMTWPVVEGRLFMHGHDGVYCYDLRQMATK